MGVGCYKGPHLIGQTEGGISPMLQWKYLVSCSGCKQWNLNLFCSMDLIH